MKVESGRRAGLEAKLETLFELEWDCEEIFESGDPGRAWREDLLVPSKMPIALLLPFRAGVRGGERVPLACNDPDLF